ncbi:MAG: hypothetical protein IT384_07390 [Deltaproteobacteria bacterium]|nr:hypothetical protein [Deltaproteobacteria bacterium]
MAVRLTLEPETQALLKAVRARIDALPGVTSEKRSGFDVFTRGADVFLEMEIRREHISLDLWLPHDQLEEARSSGTARSHPFLGEDALKVRFERAADLARVARWIEESYAYAPHRDRARREHAARMEAEAKIQREREEREAKAASERATIPAPPLTAPAPKGRPTAQRRAGTAPKSAGKTAKKAATRKAKPAAGVRKPKTGAARRGAKAKPKRRR